MHKKSYIVFIETVRFKTDVLSVIATVIPGSNQIDPQCLACVHFSNGARRDKWTEMRMAVRFAGQKLISTKAIGWLCAFAAADHDPWMSTPFDWEKSGTETDQINSAGNQDGRIARLWWFPATPNWSYSPRSDLSKWLTINFPSVAGWETSWKGC